MRLAVLIGSAARGGLRADSDVDLLLALADAERRRVDALRVRLESAAGRPVDLVSIESAAARPLLLHDALKEGRVLVDRDARWPVLIADKSYVAAHAAQASREVRKEMHALLAELSEVSRATRRSRRKVVSRLEEIRRDRRALRNALDHFADATAFVAAWGSEDPETINLRDQVERPYERIVNDLQELIDLCEAEEADRAVREPEGSGPDRPGRWRRAALRGHLNHAQSARWQAIALGRQRLAHHYVDLAEHQATDIYERANELLSELPGAVRGLGGWIEGLWPADEGPDPAQGTAG